MTYRTPMVTGDVVALAPHTDRWMMGARYGRLIDIRMHNGSLRYCVDLGAAVVWYKAGDLLGAVAGTPVGGQRCSHCGARLVNEDCPNYGNGPEHADMDRDLRGALEGWGQ